MIKDERNKKLTKNSIDFILAFCEKLRIDKKNTDIGKADLKVDEGYITSTMLNGIYNILINEGYSRKYLDEIFGHDYLDNEGNINKNDLDKYKERTKEACKFYHINQPSEVERFFKEDPAGIKLREEIDKL